MKILITGDLVVNYPYQTSNIDQNINDLFEKSDFNIVNLEAPVTTSTSKIIKTGPHLKADKNSTLQVLKSLEFDVVTLANNHVLDYDEQGVDDTLEFCKENDIKTVGAGMNLKEASQTLYLDTKKGKIAIINFAENEWASATGESAGAHPMDIIDNAKSIKDARVKADFVFVIVHGGHEYYNLPSPRMQKQYRFYAEQGADIVIGHHTHCISGNEVHKGVPIYYSLGNFLFTSQSTIEDWYTGLVLEVEIIKGVLKTKLHPVEQERHNFALSLISDDEKIDVLNRTDEYSEIIKDNELINKKWAKYVDNEKHIYLQRWSPVSYINNPYLKAFLFKIKWSFKTKRGLVLFLNLMRCEAHSDLSKEIIQNYLKK